MRRAKLLYLSSNEWGNLGRRKVRLAHEFAQLSGVASVLYVNPPVPSSVLDVLRGHFEPSHLGDNRRVHANALLGRSHRVADRLWIYTGSTKTFPLTRNERLRRSRLLNVANQQLYKAGLRNQLRRLAGDDLVVWLSHPLQVWALDAFPEKSLSCFDWTDDWLQFTLLPVADRDELERAQERMLREVDVIFAVSQSLYHRAKQANANTHRAPNATDFVEIAESIGASSVLAKDLGNISGPRLGYIGQIADNVDLDLVRCIAESHPDWSLIFVGPVWSSREEIVAHLSTLDNVHFLGGRPHAQMAEFLRGFDVCLMPHLRNALTASMDPTKLYDYLASGKPIVSTEVAGTERFTDVLRIANTPEAFITAIESALQENGAKARIRVERARRNSWPDRARDMWASVADHLMSESIYRTGHKTQVLP